METALKCSNRMRQVHEGSVHIYINVYFLHNSIIIFIASHIYRVNLKEKNVYCKCICDSLWKWNCRGTWNTRTRSVFVYLGSRPRVHSVDVSVFVAVFLLPVYSSSGVSNFWFLFFKLPFSLLRMKSIPIFTHTRQSHSVANVFVYLDIETMWIAIPLGVCVWAWEL